MRPTELQLTPSGWFNLEQSLHEPEAVLGVVSRGSRNLPAPHAQEEDDVFCVPGTVSKDPLSTSMSHTEQLSVPLWPLKRPSSHSTHRPSTSVSPKAQVQEPSSLLTKDFMHSHLLVDLLKLEYCGQLRQETEAALIV